jgi:hypothetical protein
LTGAVQQPDEWRKRPHEELRRLHDDQRRRFGAFECDRFRRELAEDDMQRRHDRERNGYRYAVGGRLRDGGRQEGEAGLDHRGERRLANPAEAEAGHGDAQLCRGDVVLGRADGATDGARAAVPFRDQLVDARLAHRDD